MPTATRTEQLSLRVPPATKRILQQGASIAGQTLTDFLISSGADRARELLQEQRVISMSQTAFDAFVLAMDDPEIRPATPLAAESIADYAASVREDGALDW